MNLIVVDDKIINLAHVTHFDVDTRPDGGIAIWIYIDAGSETVVVGDLAVKLYEFLLSAAVFK